MQDLIQELNQDEQQDEPMNQDDNLADQEMQDIQRAQELSRRELENNHSEVTQSSSAELTTGAQGITNVPEFKEYLDKLGGRKLTEIERSHYEELALGVLAEKQAEKERAEEIEM